MAIRCSFPISFSPIRGKNSLNTQRTSVICSCNGERISLVKKVFEDREIGVICYRDEKGELVCEGYDEGPRFTFQTSEYIKFQRQAGRYDLLMRRLNIKEFNN